MDRQNQQIFSDLLDRLGYKASPDLITKETPVEYIPENLQESWNEINEKFHVDAVYFLGNAPVIYFKQFDAHNKGQEIAEFHRKVWNQSQVPLIFAILPGDIRIYNGYKAPRQVSGTLEEPSRLDYELRLSSQDDLWDRLEVFTRLALDSGSFWRDYGAYFTKETRADQMLIANLRYIRRELIKDLEVRFVHNLIGRSIFALYLQDRGVLADNFFSQYIDSKYSKYTELLSSHKDTYIFFELLRKQFNGDMFPVTEDEKKAVTPEHLQTLQRLFTVDSIKGGQMLFFWAYNFEFIPIELISAIYEEFLYQEESGKDGAYYTPPLLVDFMLNQVVPKNQENYNLSFLDPACGSGIFLVEAYRRLVIRWSRAHKRRPGPGELAELLKLSIFGIDIKRQALHVAAFSLYLAMLDYIEPRSIWMKVHFPPLIGTNLIEADFFDDHAHFHGKKFDFVVGNPPWESKLTTSAQNFKSQLGYEVGDKQIVQLFLLHTPDFCKPDGQVALLSSSKSVLYNKSGPNISFRQRFFRTFTTTKIFDFSAIRRFLFEKGDAPAIAIFYTPQRPKPKSVIFYGAPKLTHLVHRFAITLIETNDIKQIPLWQVLESIESMKSGNSDTTIQQKTLFPSEEDSENYIHSINIWKVALWGNSFDYILLQTLQEFPTLTEVIKKRSWVCKGGFNLNGPDKNAYKYAEWLDNKPYLHPDHFERYGVDISQLERRPAGIKYYRRGIPEQFKAPLVLFKRTQHHRQIGAAYFDRDCSYSDLFTCIAGQQDDHNLLKAVTALLNSDIVQYYLFLTSASWGVEREEVKAGEMRAIPFPFLDTSTDDLAIIASLVDTIAEKNVTTHNNDKSFRLEAAFEKEHIIARLEQELNQMIYKSFHLTDQEIQHISETVQYTIGFFNNPVFVQQRPPIEMQLSYAQAYIQFINPYLETIGKKLTAIIYTDDRQSSPVHIVQFASKRSYENIPDIQWLPLNEKMRRILVLLPGTGLEYISRSMYHRRSFRIYDQKDDLLYIIKPAEKRLWTIGIALNDAEETITELTRSLKV